MTGIVKGLSTPEVEVICNDPGEFVAAVVGTRNYLTHLDESDGDVVLDGEDLFVAIQKLELLMVMLLLKHLGLPADEVLARVQECGRFNTDPFHLEGDRQRNRRRPPRTSARR